MEKYITVIDDNAEMLPRTHKAWAEQGFIQLCSKTAEEAADGFLPEQNHHKNLCLIALVEDYLKERLTKMIKLIRCVTTTPILILTSDYKAKVGSEALALGANSYTAIPGTLTEGINKGLSLIRQYQLNNDKNLNHDLIAVSHDFHIHLKQRMVILNERELKLPHKQFDLLHLFAVNKNQMLTYKEIYETVWGGDYNKGVERMIWSMVDRLRSSLNAVPDTMDYIHNVRYAGYQFLI